MRVGYFSQHQVEELDYQDTPIQHMTRLMPDAKPGAVRAQLARFGFSGDKATIEVKHLSGGERARLALALITRDAPHMLILDEPTNHLDVDARESLAQALNDYNGAVVVVSHDRHLLELTSDRLVLIADGTAKEFAGTLDDYRDLLLSRGDTAASNDDEAPGKRLSKKDQRKAAAEAREQTQSLRKAVKQAETEMADFSAKRSDIDRALFDPSGYEGPHKNVPAGQLMKTRGDIERKLEAAEAKWLEASEALELAEQAARRAS
jgi:ATP-binding cassette subfamily F protein 3